MIENLHFKCEELVYVKGVEEKWILFALLGDKIVGRYTLNLRFGQNVVDGYLEGDFIKGVFASRLLVREATKFLDRKSKEIGSLVHGEAFVSEKIRGALKPFYLAEGYKEVNPRSNPQEFEVVRAYGS